MPLSLTPRRAVAVLALLALIGCVRLATTYRVFTQTVDEPIHVAAGYEWLQGRYELDVEHPPLARVFFALDAFADPSTKLTTHDRVEQGNELLYRDNQYRRNLALARAGNLPFFLLGLLTVFLWARWLHGNAAGLLAAALLSALPPFLAHAGLTTTDAAAASTLVAALYCFARWLEEPSWKRTFVLGFAIALGLLAKFSFLLFFPIGAFVLFVPRLARLEQTPRLATAALLGFLCVWAAYRFETGRFYEIGLRSAPPDSIEATAARYSKVPGYEWVRPDLLARYHAYADSVQRATGSTGIDFVDWAKAAGYPSPLAGRNGDTMRGRPPLPPVPLRDRLLEPFRRMPIPAITFFSGAQYVRFHSRFGHDAFLFGMKSQEGWWYYFPVVLFFKTPIPLLVLAIAGMLLLRRQPLAYVPLAFLLAVLPSRINIGVRHILPIYPMLAILAAIAVVLLWKRWRIAVAVLLAWYFIGTALAHPDYLAYFNEAAGKHPERIAADSNLDWGQDLFRLASYAQQKELAPLYVSYFGSARWREHLPQAQPLPPARCVTGWIAISEMNPILDKSPAFHWLERHRPVKRIGASIRLYFIPEGGCESDP